MNIVLWIKDSPNHRALACKIHEKHGVSLIVLEQPAKKKKTLKKIAEKLADKIFCPSIDAAWHSLQQYYRKQYPELPKIKIVPVSSINSSEAFIATAEAAPHLIAVSGTSMVRSKMLSVPCSIGIVNLHTGISPYYNGGPNCTNWCIAMEQPQMIGSTVMWINEGIDAGNIITTEQAGFSGQETLPDLHIKVMEHAHDLYVKAIGKILEGLRTSVPQREIGKAKTFYSREWTLKQKLRLIRNFKKISALINAPEFKSLKDQVKTIKLP